MCLDGGSTNCSAIYHWASTTYCGYMRSKDSPKQYCFFLSAKAELPFSKVESKYFFFSTINDYDIIVVNTRFRWHHIIQKKWFACSQNAAILEGKLQKWKQTHKAWNSLMSTVEIFFVNMKRLVFANVSYIWS